jgi:RNA polymerase sigma-70 factor, ECF subfamily
MMRDPLRQGDDHALQRTDAELVSAACGGDHESFRGLYERYYGMAVGIARGRLSDRHLAEDAAQEAFAVACRRLYSLRDGSRFPEWLGTICRRTASRMARSRTNVAPIEREPASPTGNADGEAADVQQAITRLSASAREVIQLHYFSGLSYDEIARALGVSHQAVHGRMQRARRVLERWLSETNEGGGDDE